MSKIIAAGHICLDITPAFPDAAIADIGSYLVPGRLIDMHGVTISTGGSVANTGLALHVLGADAVLMGKTGTDAFGDLIYGILSTYGCESGLLRTAGEQTSYSIVLALPGMDRIFLHDAGANDTYCLEDIPQEVLQDAAVFHFGYPTLMRTMYQEEGRELLALMKHVKHAGAATSLDMSDVNETSKSGAVNWRHVLQQVLPYVDFFLPSVEELLYMLHRDLYETCQKRAGRKDLTLFITEEEVQLLGTAVLQMGAKIVLIKCGAAGLFLFTADQTVLRQIPDEVLPDKAAWSDQKRFEKSFVPHQILSASGAGDTTIAAFLHAVTTGCTPKQAVQYAAATGALCVGSYDAVSAIRPFDELEQLIEAGWAKQDLLYKGGC
ncbi:MAG: carbohydrate kinase family protein [Lachnospiraceae bacterium]